MEEFDLTIKMKAKDEAQAKEVLFVLQAIANDYGAEKILSMVEKVKNSPGIIKTALSYL